jgi:hypothetical protein
MEAAPAAELTERLKEDDEEHTASMASDTAERIA